MQNVHKYFVILETLRYRETVIDDDKNVKSNLEILKKYIKWEELQVNEILSPSLQNTSSDEDPWTYACYLHHVVLTVVSSVNWDSTEKESLISIRQQNDLFKTIKLSSRYGIVYNLPASLQQHQIFNGRPGNVHANEERSRISLIILSKVFSIPEIAATRSLDNVILEMMAGIYFSAHSDVVRILETLWEHTAKENYFRYLLILKSITTSNSQMQEAIHKDLLKKLTEPGGFKLLVLNTVPSMQGSAEIPNWKRYDVVARIIAHKGHSSSFNKQMIRQIFDFIQNAIFDVMESSLIPAAIVTLRKLYLLRNETRMEIDRIVQKLYKPFIEPDDMIAGLVVMEANQLHAFVKLQCVLFNGSSFEALPSTALVRFLPALISLFALTEGTDLTKDLVTLISQCLANRKPEELRTVLKSLFNKEQNELQLQYLHDRVGFRKVDQAGQLQIMPQDFDSSIDLPSALVRVLKASNNNILTYNCFIQILMIFDETESNLEPTSTERDISLLQSEEELDTYLSKKFQTRISVISCLTELTAFRQFHSQFHENPNDVLKFLQNALQKRLDTKRENADTDENLTVLLAVFQEFIENAKDSEKFQGVKSSLKTYLKQVTRSELRHQIENIISTLEGGSRSTGLDSTEYNFACSLLSETQSHLRVYGISQFIRLLTNRDEETISNRHRILAMAMLALRDEESYTYLNCVRLFVCLMNSMQAEVLEALSAEYLNEAENIEFRLKVGEAILKITEELGPISYNYKDVLVNCFLNGARNPINEFRASSMSNLASLCRLLSYQVHHFFNEMMLLIESTLQSDSYLPTRRAASLVLSQLLWGMDNLMDFEETLLPIYRLLKVIVENDKDEKTRIHATNGLQYLKEKCKAFLFPEQKMEKEIKIFGIKDGEGQKKKTGHILEL